jgi:triosephosphate isomerase
MFAVGNKSPVAFAAQDVSVTTGGAQTGEVTAQAYAASGATYAIIGHSERRAQGDTNSRVQEKLSHALAQGLIPILCIGEHERDTEGQYLAFLREELVTAMKNLSSKEQAKIIVAYEPIWAIGKTAADAMGANELGEIVLYIRKILSELFQGGNATRTLILYGGSVEPDNIRDLGSHTGINGFLVGHASVDPKKFTLLIKQLEYV